METFPPRIQIFQCLIFASTIGILTCISCLVDVNVNVCNIVRWKIGMFSCDVVTEVGNYWKRDGIFLNIGTHIIENQFSQRFKLFDNFSLVITSVLLSDEGEYSCLNNKTTVETYNIIVNIPPRVLMLHNGSTLVNATYDRDRVNQIYYGEETYVEEGSQVNVTCLAEGAKPEATLTWTKNGNPIDSIVHTVTDYNQQENRTNDTKSVLQFRANEENLTITCNSSLHGTDITTLVSATFRTYVKPTVFYLLNGKLAQDSIYVPENKYVNISCFAKGARPAADLTLEGYNQSVESTVNRSSDIDSVTFDSSSTLVLKAKFDKATFSCTITIPKINHSYTIILELKTFELPKPVITVNGGQSNEVKFVQGDTVTIICNASAARPTPTLTLTRNGKTFHESKSDNSGSSGVILFFNFLPKHDEVVMCICFLDQVNKTKKANITFHRKSVTEASSENNATRWVLFPTALAVVVLLVILMIYFFARRRNGTKSTDLSANREICMEDTSDARFRGQQEGHQKEYLTGSSISYPKPPELDLPKVPTDSDVHQYCDLPEENAYEMNFHSEYYTDMGSIDAGRKMFSGKDICFILNMKTGHIYDRWMGSIAVSKKEKKCVILSTVTDDVFRENEVQWDKFVKQMLEVPEKSFLSKVEGIGISKGKLYLIHEHVTCETLDTRISAPFLRTEVIGHVLGILEGIEIIHSSGLLHPGLTARKILLTEHGVCKLYDFCLYQDAANVVRIKKSRMIYTLNQFASEALLGDTYNKMSDIWSVAVVIWEILSCGSCPFPNEEQLPGSHNVHLKLPATWPKKYKLVRNKLLYECWNEDTSLRPSILQLKSSFVESFQSLDTYGGSDLSTDETTTSYVHMEGVAKTEDQS